MSVMAQENTTNYDYDYSNFNETDRPAVPCDRSSDNYLGAQMSILYGFMFLFGLFGNGLVLLIIYRFEKLTTVTNILLLNLVFSSLTFTSSLPFMGVYMLLEEWIFGNVMCKLVGSVYYLGYYSSVLFLALLTFDRHIAVVYSLGAAGVRNRIYALVSCAMVWLVSGLACIRPMILHNTFVYKLNNKFHCDEHPGGLDRDVVKYLKPSGIFFDFFFFYFVPLALIIYCYLKIAFTVISSNIITKFRTVRLIFVIIQLFFVCWTPYNILVLLTRVAQSTECEEIKRRAKALHISRYISYLYFCISPILYTFVGKKFQNYFLQLLVKRFPKLNKHISVSQSSRTYMSNMSCKSTLPRV